MANIALRIAGYTGRQSIVYLMGQSRAVTGVGLRAAKVWGDQLLAEDRTEVPVPSVEDAWRLGANLLRDELVAVVQVVVDGAVDPTPIFAPTPPRMLTCPRCGKLAQTECGHCGWLRFPYDRRRVDSAARCGRCGFAYRWDGSRSGHCGNGTTDERLRASAGGDPPAESGGPVGS
jgi:hypothetical protein